MNIKNLFFLLGLFAFSCFLRLNMQEDEKIIGAILQLEKERKRNNLGIPQSEVSRLSKKSGATSRMIKEVFNWFERSKENYDTLYVHVVDKKEEYWFLKNIHIRKNISYPPEIKFNSLKEQIITHIYQAFEQEEQELKLKDLKHIHPVVDKVEKQKDGSFNMRIRPIQNIDFKAIAPNIQFYHNDQLLEVQELPFFFEGDVTGLKSVITNPFTKETMTYESN